MIHIMDVAARAGLPIGLAEASRASYRWSVQLSADILYPGEFHSGVFLMATYTHFRRART
jgi:hypothetical protein